MAFNGATPTGTNERGAHATVTGAGPSSAWLCFGPPPMARALFWTGTRNPSMNRDKPGPFHHEQV